MAGKPNVVLDIDETLVYFIDHKYRAASWDTLPEAEKAKYAIHETKNKSLFVLRPHLKEFLTYIFKHCTVGLWTLSDKEYAKGVRDLFLVKDHPERKVSMVLSDEEAEIVDNDYGHSKDLNYIYDVLELDGFSRCNTFLIDDNPPNSVNKANKHSSITVEPFALFGTDKTRSGPYKPSSDDSVFPELIHIIRKVISHTRGCYPDRARRNKHVFTPEAVKEMGLESYLRKIVRKSEVVTGLAVGESEHFLPKTPKSKPRLFKRVRTAKSSKKSSGKKSEEKACGGAGCSASSKRFRTTRKN